MILDHVGTGRAEIRRFGESALEPVAVNGESRHPKTRIPCPPAVIGAARSLGVRRVSGRGLLLGLHLDRPAVEVQTALFGHRILTGTSTDPQVLRLLPPLSFSRQEADLLLSGLGGRAPVTKRDFLALEDWSFAEIEELLALAGRIKRGEISGGLEKKVLAMVFMDPSLRTRTSFETAMFLHGGHAVVLEPGKGSWSLETEPGAVMDGDTVEHIVDAARVLGRYADALGVRSFPRGNDWAVRARMRFCTASPSTARSR